MLPHLLWISLLWLATLAFALWMVCRLFPASSTPPPKGLGGALYDRQKHPASIDPTRPAPRDDL